MTDALSPATPLTERQKRFVGNFVSTGRAGEAALRAGYSDTSQGYWLKQQPKIQEAIQEEMEKQGVTNAMLVRKLKEGLNATYPEKRSAEGFVMQEKSPDFFTRDKYLDKAFKVKGAYAPEKHLHEHRQLIINITPEVIKGLMDAGAIRPEEVIDLGPQDYVIEQESSEDPGPDLVDTAIYE